MKYRYVTVDISTTEGLKKAERLKAEGEKVLPAGYPIATIGTDKVMFSIPMSNLNKGR